MAINDWVFGIDGGGTSSRIRAESLSGDRLYEGSSGGTNLNATSVESVAITLRSLIEGAMAAGLDPLSCRAGFIGSAGVDLPEDRKSMTGALQTAFRTASSEGNPVFGAANDSEPALVGALDDTEGILLIAGTGSIAFGRTRDGRRERAGGWGHFLGDEGSAFWIAFEGIRRGIHASEGRIQASGLLEASLRHFALADAQELIPLTFWNFDKARIASFAPMVARLAGHGDSVAMSILDEAVVELAGIATSVYDRLAPHLSRKRLALYGGLLEKNRDLRSRVGDRLVSLRPELHLVEPAKDAQSGACRLARELIHA
ncbi:MAG: BadF/BadG/BcrA/BcrD ATPase family protein [Spirochaetia bacterium]|jgi:N-acetylglucosamine kinase-like BadF-type ATPase|nr:BadF/BadG/BcrA/BcrD ATPase family protein [Spirochaetia bacterium]